MANPSPVIVPATAELIDRYYGHRPPWTVHRAFAAVLDGEPVCIAGALRDGERFVAFADIRPVMRERFVKTGLRMARRVMESYRALGVPLYALAACDVPAAERFLLHLGFQPLPNGGFVWQG